MGKEFWMKVGQRLQTEGRAEQGQAGQGLPEARDGAGMRQAWDRNQNGWSRGWAHWREEAGTGIQTKITPHAWGRL